MSGIAQARGATSTDLSSVLVVGFARTGQSVAVAALRRGARVVALDDRPSDAARRVAGELGVELYEAPRDAALAALVGEVERIVVSPGVPPSHPVFALAAPGALCSEIELAFELSDKPIVAITGTNGKTTVTELVAAMLRCSGRAALAAGNIGLPYVEAIAEEEAELFVVEVSSFQLKYTRRFAPSVATYLNFAEDHLDWHDSLEDYANSKAMIFAHQAAESLAIANADDPVTLAAAGTGVARLATFGATAGDYHEEAGVLVGPEGEPLVGVDALPRGLPHDRLNALAALATALGAGATPEGCREALGSWHLPPHRVELVASAGGVSYYDDSKATTPSAVLAALGGFSSVVLIAGGRNKGLDLSVIGEAESHGGARLRAVVAIGEASGELAAALPGATLREATSMREAVEVASTLALPGDAVLLSPGCASFDWYRDYVARGEDFQAEVRRLLAASGDRTK